MLILDEHKKTVIIDNIYTPTHVEYFFVLDLELEDFTMVPLFALEDMTSPGVKIDVNGFQFMLPTTYYILIFSEETSQLDSVKIEDLTAETFSVVGYNDETSKIGKLNYRIVDYVNEYTFAIPFLNRHQMLCHPVTPKNVINISSTCKYSKYLKHLGINDLI